ncbi:AAA ATPase domain-containing protein [Fibrobacter sp. UWH9]|uniref:AAA family ATPase n=1 Tax=Fibrobacter sp. UWH9 TaxID=1896213 RepID=UPI00091B31B6|nr:AAA family ATPase [Fibrobacter sp. UWH9]SHH46518.1 AAA ATPase domain-containing protein [Fibrobacter sp. UWH9]
MKIESIHIRNVRGLQDANIQLGMVPNKPSLLVAPNGSGKSSFAIAFQSLQKNKISVPENDVYNNDLSRRTSLEIKTDDGKSYIANEEKNEIQKEFSVFVINSKNKPKASIRNINGTRVPSVKMTVDPIILVNKIPKDVKLDYSLQKEKCIDNVVSGTIPSVKDLLNNNRFISSFETADLQNVKRSVKVIEEFVARLKKYDGTKKAVWEMVEKNDLSVLKDLPILSCRIEHVKSIFPEDNDVQLYLKTIQLVFAYLANPQKFKEKIEFARYKIGRI